MTPRATATPPGDLTGWRWRGRLPAMRTNKYAGNCSSCSHRIAEGLGYLAKRDGRSVVLCATCKRPAQTETCKGVIEPCPNPAVTHVHGFDQCQMHHDVQSRRMDAGAASAARAIGYHASLQRRV